MTVRPDDWDLDQLDDVVSDTARHLVVAGDLDASLDRVAVLARELVPGCRSASVTLRAGPELACVAASDRLGTDLDTAQFALGGGPALQVLEAGGPTWVDMGDRGAWADFAARADARGIRGLLSLALVTDDGGREDRLGALTLYADAATAFREPAHEVALVVAAHLTILVATEQRRGAADRRARMRAALSSRAVIAQATGILMARRGLDAGAAFAVLRRASVRTNTRLHQVAARIVDDHGAAERDRPAGTDRRD